MREITNQRDIEKMKEDLRQIRQKEQRENDDYEYDEDGKIEICENCGTPIDSHDRCPRCDY
jgi:rubrerythrin